MGTKTKKSINIECVTLKGPLSERVYKELKRAILEGHFSPGELLPEDFLTDATGASRTPVREALVHLQRDGLVKIVPRKGARIPEMNSEELSELVEARALLETVFLEKAMDKISLVDIEKIKDKMSIIIEEMKNIDQDSQDWKDKRIEYSNLDFNFHRMLVAAIDNRFILDFYDTLLEKVILYSHHTVIKYPRHFLQSAKEHENILNSILDKKPEKTKELIKVHLYKLNKRLTSMQTS